MITLVEVVGNRGATITQDVTAVFAKAVPEASAGFTDIHLIAA